MDQSAVAKEEFEIIEEELRQYPLMKKAVSEKLEELEKEIEAEIGDGIKAISNNDLYLVGSKKNSGKNYQRAHNLVRNTRNSTQEQALAAIYHENKKEYVLSMIIGTPFQEMLKIVETIDYALARFDNSTVGCEREKAKLVRERYFDKMILTPAEDLAEKYNIDRKTVYNWCDDVILEIAIVQRIMME